MSANWKLWVLSSGVVCGLSCGDSGAGGSIDDGGDTVADGGRDAGRLDGGSDLDGSRRDGSMRDGSNNNTGDGGSDPGCGVLMATIRDFTPQTNPDFEKFDGTAATVGLLKNTLDDDNLPVFNSITGTVAGAKAQLTSKAKFDQWYRDVDGVNIAIPVAIENQSSTPGMYSYSSSAFFPIDGKGFGNYADSGHNFHFTTQIAAGFTYRGGEVFQFEGDDDLWIFVNGRLALDLGGLHPAVKGQIDFDAQASKLNIELGETYRMDIFHAERHTNQSNFKFSTTISCFTEAPPIFL